jgi:hypothetical protein
LFRILISCKPEQAIAFNYFHDKVISLINPEGKLVIITGVSERIEKAIFPDLPEKDLIYQ